MKKYFIVLLVTVLSGVFSQISAQSDIGLGIRAGINLSDQYTTGEGEFVIAKGLLRYHGGAWFNYFFTEKLAVQPELLISGKGSDWDDPDYNVKDLLTYIDLPVLLRYQIIDMLNIHAGPQFGYLLSARQKDNDTGDFININDYYKKPDIGLVLGIEGNFPANINLAVRYVFGVIAASSDVQYIDPWLNNFLMVSVGYRFLGK